MTASRPTAIARLATAPTIAAIVFGAASALQGAILIRKVIDIGRPPPVERLSSVAQPRGPAFDFSASALFGSSPIVAGVAPTESTLVLRGVLALSDPRAGLALIASNSGAPSRLVRTGSAVDGRVILREVRSREVLLERDGVTWTLQLPRGALAGALLVSAPDTAAPELAAELSPEESAVLRKEEAANRAAVTPAQLRLRDPVGEMFDANPAESDDGTYAGMRIGPGRDRQRFAAAGFLPGDVVTKIGSQPATPGAATAEALARIAVGDFGGQVQVRRDGHPVTLVMSAAR